jgi:hypothetical protein
MAQLDPQGPSHSTYSFADLQKTTRAVWDGVANPVALRHLREMAVGDDGADLTTPVMRRRSSVMRRS